MSKARRGLALLAGERARLLAKDLTERNGKSQAEAGKVFGVSQPAVGHYLKGQLPDLNAVGEAMKNLGLSADFFFAGDVSDKPKWESYRRPSGSGETESWKRFQERSLDSYIKQGLTPEQASALRLLPMPESGDFSSIYSAIASLVISANKSANKDTSVPSDFAAIDRNPPRHQVLTIERLRKEVRELRELIEDQKRELELKPLDPKPKGRKALD